MGMNSIIFLAADTEKITMGQALLNTVLSIVIVFAVLIFISFVISLFKYINKAEQSAARKKSSTAPAPEPVSAPVSVPEVIEEEELSDDLELVAVITAAIHAYEEAAGNTVPADGLVVRSIRRVNKSRWQNA